MTLNLGGCAATPYKDSQITTLPADEIYRQGKDALSNNDYKAAIRHFKSLEIFYPGNPHTIQSQLELAFTYQKDGDPASAIATAERFIHNEPEHPNADYAYYLKALVNFDQAIKAAESGNKELINTIPLYAQLSLQNFSELTTRFPNSKYNVDARQRTAYLHEFIPQQEINLAKLYIDQEKYAEAALHSKNIIENFPDSGSVTEAATLTNIAYEMLGITALPQKDTDDGTAVTGMPEGTIETEIPEADRELSMIDESSTTNTEQAAQTKLKNEAWLLAQDPQHYTIQLLATSNKEALTKYIKRNQIEMDTAYTQKSVNGKQWFTLFYGSYMTKNDASETINGLSEDMLKVRPWVRQFAAVQADINN